MAATDVTAGRCRFHSARGDNRQRYAALDHRGVVQHALGRVRNIGFRVQRAAVGVVVGRHGDGIDPRGFRQARGGHRIRQGDALRFTVLAGVQLHPHREVPAHSLAHGGNDLKQQASAILQAAAVVIIALVAGR